jgi:RNA polymerase II subunit A small phosphatase-like protein
LEKALLILDLDETLVYATKTSLARASDFSVFDYQVYKRPFLDHFFEQIIKHYKVAVWSSAGNEYVNAIVSNLSIRTSLEFIWGRDQAVQKRMSHDYYETGNDSEYYYVKPLKKIKRKGYLLNRILILDDSPHKSKLNFGNAIYPKSYKGEVHDDELNKLIMYLESIKDEPNFRAKEKRNWRNKYDL